MVGFWERDPLSGVHRMSLLKKARQGALGKKTTWA